MPHPISGCPSPLPLQPCLPPYPAYVCCNSLIDRIDPWARTLPVALYTSRFQILFLLVRVLSSLSFNYPCFLCCVSELSLLPCVECVWSGPLQRLERSIHGAQDFFMRLCQAAYAQVSHETMLDVSCAGFSWDVVRPLMRRFLMRRCQASHVQVSHETMSGLSYADFSWDDVRLLIRRFPKRPCQASHAQVSKWKRLRKPNDLS